MFSHTPVEYKNPFKKLLKRDGVDSIASNEEDIFYEDNDITAFIASSSEPENQGNVLIIPNNDYENIYDIPDSILGKIHIFSKKVAIAMKEVYGCDGVSVRQHNEPAGYQDVWHYHLHVIPRYIGDNLYLNYVKRKDSDPETRAKFAAKLREYFKNNS